MKSVTTEKYKMIGFMVLKVGFSGLEGFVKDRGL